MDSLQRQRETLGRWRQTFSIVAHHVLNRTTDIGLDLTLYRQLLDKCDFIRKLLHINTKQLFIMVLELANLLHRAQH